MIESQTVPYRDHDTLLNGFLAWDRPAAARNSQESSVSMEPSKRPGLQSLPGSIQRFSSVMAHWILMYP